MRELVRYDKVAVEDCACAKRRPRPGRPTGAARRESLRRILGALPRLRVRSKKGRTEEQPINRAMDRFLRPPGCHQNSADGDQSDAGNIPHAQPLAEKDHGKDCHQHHAQLVERSDLSGIAKAEGAEIA